MALAEPKCRTQSGFGEKRVTICVYLLAFGSGGRAFSSAAFADYPAEKRACLRLSAMLQRVQQGSFLNKFSEVLVVFQCQLFTAREG
jgi:hypothetical protein